MENKVVEKARCNVLRWFKGKSCDNAAAAIDMLLLDEAEGCWLPGHSRKIRAALTKANVAQNIARKHRKELEGLKDYRVDKSDTFTGWDVAFLLQFCSRSYVSRAVDFEGVKARVVGETPDARALRAVIDRAAQFYADFKPLWDLMRDLDNTRPKPVFTSVGASPTVSRLLASLGLVSPQANVRLCPIRWEKVSTPKGGWYWVGIPEWPEGTRHNRSRYAMGTSRHDQCHACGHAIKNPDNWVPLILDQVNDQGATPYSLFVGRDCAKTIFGLKMTGEFTIKDLDAELAR